MDERKEAKAESRQIIVSVKNTPWLSVPQFGDWDQKGEFPDYSMDFSKIRENRKQNKSRASLGNEEELIASSTTVNKSSNTLVHNDHDHVYHHHDHQNHSSTARRSIFSYFNCCAKA